MTGDRVLLVIPPGLPGTTPNREGAGGLGAVEPRPNAFRYPPHTVATVAACLLERGYQAMAIDAVAMGLSEDEAIERIRVEDADLVAVHVSWATREADQRFLTSLRAAGPLPSPIVAFGVSTRYMDQCLSGADHVLQGEPELALGALCRRLLEGGASARLSHTISPSASGFAGYGEADLLLDPESLPFPAWHVLPVGRYPALTVLSSRGCDHACHWCPYTVAQGARYRALLPERVVDELRALVARHAPARIIFRDPVFAHDGERAKRICRLVLSDRLLRPGRNLVWECESRPEHFDEALVRLLSLSGCVAIKVGLESTDGDLLRREGRLAPGQQPAEYVATVARLCQWCARWGVACRIFCMAGLPGETMQMVRATAQFIASLQPPAVSVKVFERYPAVLTSDTCADADVRAQTEALKGIQRGDTVPGGSGAVRWRRRVARLVYGISETLGPRPRVAGERRCGHW